MTATAAVGGDVGLDQLLAEAANGRNRFIPGLEAVRAVGSLARRPRTLARQGASLASQLARVARGTSTRAPARGDRRFSDPAWSENWLFRRLCQGYLTVGDVARALVDEAELDWATDQRLRLAVDNIIDALAPTNFPLTNPAVLKTTIDRGGANFVAGARHALRDATSPARLPANVDTEPFEVGQTLAVSPGAVVRRESMYELIQYQPRSDEVRQTPLIIIPPMISKYYVVDLAPTRSLVEYLTERGQQTFVLSWRNPTRDQAGWTLDDYITAIVEALDTAREIARSGSTHVLGLCAGGVASTCAVGHLAQTGRLDHVASLSLCVTVLDMSRGGPVMSLSSPEVAKAATARVGRRGYLPGTELSRTFAWLRPNDMIWNNWVNNYYLGRKPPAFDLLYWNQDSMNMPAALHRDMLEIGVENPLPRPGAATILGTPMDLSKITCDAYIVGAETDHLTPWPSCYRSTQLLGGETRYVLSTSGHIAAVINPPGNPRSAYRTGAASAAGPEEWLETATNHQGTWWEDWDGWLAARAGGLKPAPSRLGTRRYPPLDQAPGRYVFDRSRG